jgi:hypothetical protein
MASMRVLRLAVPTGSLNGGGRLLASRQRCPQRIIEFVQVRNSLVRCTLGQ